MAGIGNPFARLMLAAQRIRYGKGCRFCGIPVIIRTKGSRIALGANVTVNSGFLSNLIGLYQRTVIMARDGGVIEIGDGAGLSGATVYARRGIRIGAKTLVGANTKILDNDFHPVDPETRRAHSTKGTLCKRIVIGENVLIGCNCLILKGTVIGDNTTIGAGSVVCGGIPANCVAAGNPAKVIRYFAGDRDGEIDG